MQRRLNQVGDRLLGRRVNVVERRLAIDQQLAARIEDRQVRPTERLAEAASSSAEARSLALDLGAHLLLVLVFGECRVLDVRLDGRFVVAMKRLFELEHQVDGRRSVGRRHREQGTARGDARLFRRLCIDPRRDARRGEAQR